MYIITPGSLLLVQLRYSVDGQVCLNNLHYRYDGAVNIADGATAAREVADWFQNAIVVGRWGTLWKAVAHNLATLTETRAQWIRPDRFSPQITAAPPVAGTVAGDEAGALVAVRMTKASELSGRQYVGGISVPGVPASSNVLGRLAVGVQPAWTSLTDVLSQQIPVGGSITTGPYTPVISHKNTLLPVTPVDRTVLHTTLRTMRRRVVGRGI